MKNLDLSEITLRALGCQKKGVFLTLTLFHQVDFTLFYDIYFFSLIPLLVYIIPLFIDSSLHKWKNQREVEIQRINVLKNIHFLYNLFLFLI